MDTMHRELYIMRGLDVRLGGPGGAFYFEPEKEILDLLNTSGFTLDTYGWIPKLPQFKSGVWVDSAVSPGRYPISLEYANVTETINLTCATATPAERYALESQLARMAYYAMRFNTSDTDISPVYLRWWAEGAPGEQYALIYSLQIAYNSDALSDTPNINSMVITIEREPGWRGIAPGDTPKYWSDQTATNWTLTPTTGTLASNLATGHLFGDDLSNTDEITGTFNDSTDKQIFRKAWLDIPAEDIPGDMPALLELSLRGRYADDSGLPITSSYDFLTGVYISRRTRLNDMFYNNDPTQGVYGMHIFSANVGANTDLFDTTAGTDTTFAANQGCVDSGGATAGSSRNHAAVSFATVATDAVRLTWTLPSNLAGRYAAFIRMGASAAQIGCHLTYGDTGDELRTPEILPTGTVGANTEFWPLHYMGVVDLPVSPTLAMPNLDGVNVAIRTGAYRINLRARRVSGTPTMQICDLILMPMDEGFLSVDFNQEATNRGSSYSISSMTIDNTGVLSRGKPGLYVVGVALTSVDFLNAEVKGQPLYLEPKKDNRLFFLFTMTEEGTTPVLNQSSLVASAASAPDRLIIDDLRVMGNIVPRWAGIRDV